MEDFAEDFISCVQLGQTVVSTRVGSESVPAPRNGTAQLPSNTTAGQAPGALVLSAPRLNGSDARAFEGALKPTRAPRGQRRNSTVASLVAATIRATLGAEFADAVWPVPEDDDEEVTVSSRTHGAILLFSLGLILIPLGTYATMKYTAMSHDLAGVTEDERNRLLYALAVMVLLGCSRGLVGGFTDTVIVVAEYYWSITMSLVVMIQVFEAVLFFLAIPLWLHAVDYHMMSTSSILVIGTVGCFYFNGMLSTSANIAEALLFKSCAAVFQPALFVAQTRFCFDHIDGRISRLFMWAGFVCEFVSHCMFSTFALYYLDVNLETYGLDGGKEVDGWRWCLTATAMVAGVWTLFTLVLIHWSHRLPGGILPESRPLWDQSSKVLRAARDAGGTAALGLLLLCGVLSTVLASIGIYRTIWLTYMGFGTREITFVRFVALTGTTIGYMFGRFLGKLNAEIRGLRGRVEVAAMSDMFAFVAFSMFYLVIPYYTGFFSGVYTGVHDGDTLAYAGAMIVGGMLGSWCHYGLTEPMLNKILRAYDPAATPAGMAAFNVVATTLGGIIGPLMVGLTIDFNGYTSNDKGIAGKIAYGWDAVCFEVGCGSVDCMAVFALMLAHAWMHGNLCGRASMRTAWFKDSWITGGE